VGDGEAERGAGASRCGFGEVADQAGVDGPVAGCLARSLSEVKQGGEREGEVGQRGQPGIRTPRRHPAGPASAWPAAAGTATRVVAVIVVRLFAASTRSAGAPVVLVGVVPASILLLAPGCRVWRAVGVRGAAGAGPEAGPEFAVGLEVLGF